MATLESLNFDNLALCSLPTDKERNNAAREVKDVCFTLVNQTPVSNPRLVACSFDALALLDLQPLEASRPDFVEYFSGNKRLPGSETAAHCYCGFQAGYFSGQLGDGAAMYLGEIVNARGERWEIQLKGAGVTPFSYTRDGRKVLRSSIREFLCCEAMHYLGVPTIRAGCCVTSDTMVLRDKDYSGIHVEERASLVLRISPTFIRFGSFEIFKPADPVTGYSGPSAGRTDLLHQLLDYTIKNFFPEVYRDHKDLEDRYLAFYKKVTLLTAQLVAHWQCVGFCHGVLNTDNMSIVGVTLDYGPFGFMDFYDPSYLSQISDVCLRNSVERQPEICKWDLLKLAESLQEVLPLEKSTAALEELFDSEFKRCFATKMRRKLGLSLDLPTDTELIQSLFDTMEKTAADFTNTFRCLSRITPTNCKVAQSDEDVLDYLVSQCLSLQGLIKASSVTLEMSQLLKFVRIAWKTRPTVVTHLEKEAEKYQIENERRQKEVERLKMLTQEQKEENDRKLWALWIKSYKARLDLEYDQQNADEMNEERVKTMKSNNPRFILRNYVIQRAIAAAEKGDFSVVQNIFKELQTPYSDDDESDEFKPSPKETSNRSPCRQDEAFKTYSDKTSNDYLNICIT